MQLLVSSIVVLAWLGCTGADTPEAPPSPTPSPAPAPSKAGSRRSPRSDAPKDASTNAPASDADRYLVLVATEREMSALDPIEARLRKQASDGFAPFRLSSTDWSGLRP